MIRGIISLALALAPLTAASAQPTSASRYQTEWVCRSRYGFQDEWWRLFHKYQIAILDEEKRRGYVLDYAVFKPGLHTSEESRWDYRIIKTYAVPDESSHEVERDLFPDVAARKRDENRRWELTTNHRDLPIQEIDPYAPAE